MAELDIGTIASLATALTVVVALIFGVIQVHHTREQRRHLATIELIHNMQSPDVIRPTRTIMELPLATPAERIANDRDIKAAALTTVLFFEGWGVMAHSRVVDLHALDRAGGGAVRGTWRRLRPYVEWQRATHNEPNFGEWFQWLAEHMEEDPAPGKSQGAHIAFRGWRR